jgi:serine/threonine protein kinase
MNEYFFKSPVPGPDSDSEAEYGILQNRHGENKAKSLVTTAAAVAAPARVEAECVGSFVLGRVLGRGCTGVVREAHHRRTGFRVAVKIVDKAEQTIAEHPRLLEQVRREIAILRLTSHPHVLQLHDVLETQRHIYLVLELLSQGDLFDYIIKRGSLGRDDSLRLLSQLVRALLHLHAFNIAHRDIKPENVLVDDAGNVKLADFGMAQLLRGGSPLLRTSCGSPHYASPEVIHGRAPYDAKLSDVWSVGVLFYAMLTGRLPFDHDNIPTLLELVTAGRYHIPATVPPDLAHLIQRMLTHDPKKRIAFCDIAQHAAFHGTPWFVQGALASPAPPVFCISPGSASPLPSPQAPTKSASSSRVRDDSSNSLAVPASKRHRRSRSRSEASSPVRERCWEWPSTAEQPAVVTTTKAISSSSAASSQSSPPTHPRANPTRRPSDATILTDVQALGSLEETERRRVYRLLELRKTERMARLEVLSPCVPSSRRLLSSVAVPSPEG